MLIRVIFVFCIAEYCSGGTTNTAKDTQMGPINDEAITRPPQTFKRRRRLLWQRRSTPGPPMFHAKAGQIFQFPLPSEFRGKKSTNVSYQICTLDGKEVTDVCVKHNQVTDMITGFPLQKHKQAYVMTILEPKPKKLILMIERPPESSHKVTFFTSQGTASNLANIIDSRLHFVKTLSVLLKSTGMNVGPNEITIQNIDTYYDTVTWSIDSKGGDGCSIGKTLQSIFHTNGKPRFNLRLKFAIGMVIRGANVTLSSICFPDAHSHHGYDNGNHDHDDHDPVQEFFELFVVLFLPVGFSILLYLWCKSRQPDYHDKPQDDYMTLYSMEDLTYIRPSYQCYRCKKDKEIKNNEFAQLNRRNSEADSSRRSSMSWHGLPKEQVHSPRKTLLEVPGMFIEDTLPKFAPARKLSEQMGSIKVRLEDYTKPARKYSCVM